MKLLSYILAFYLILLSAVPCCSFDECNEDKTDLSAVPGDHEKGDDDCGNCSPFFSCEGCAAAMISYEPVQFGIPVLEISSVYSPYTHSSLSQVDYDFWQPPKRG